MPLTDAQIRNARPRSKTHKLGDGGRMDLNVMPSGPQIWRLAYRFDRAPPEFKTEAEEQRFCETSDIRPMLIGAKRSQK